MGNMFGKFDLLSKKNVWKIWPEENLKEYFLYGFIFCGGQYLLMRLVCLLAFDLASV